MNLLHQANPGDFRLATRSAAVCPRNARFRRPGAFSGAVRPPRALRTAWLAGVFVLGGLPGGHSAAEAPGVQVRFDGGRVEFRVDVALNAPESGLDAVLRDFDRMHLVFPLVAQSAVLVELPDGMRRVQADMEGCVLVFCRRVRHVLDVRTAESGWSSGISVPAASDVHAGHIRWRTDALAADLTRYRLSGWVEPDVWIPPLIGPLAVRGAVKRGLTDSLPLLEQAARERAP